MGKHVTARNTNMLPQKTRRHGTRAFVNEMWTKHRAAPGMPPTDGWKKQHDDSYLKNVMEKAKKQQARTAKRNRTRASHATKPLAPARSGQGKMGKPTCFDQARALSGKFSGPKDLSHNEKYMKDFGW